MAIPSLKEKAYLTLFHNPHMQPEGWSVDYSDLSAPARLIQRTQRRRNLLNRAATTINKLIRAFRVRAFIAGVNSSLTWRTSGLFDGASDFLMYGFQPGFMDSVWAGVRDRLISPLDMRIGRRYLAQRRALARASYWLNTSSVPPPMR